MCRALSVSRSGCYEWRHRSLSQRSQEDQALAVQIQGHFDHSRQVYGTRRLKECLAEDGKQVSRRRIARLMVEQDLQVKTKRKFKPTTDSNHAQAVAENVLNREFEVAEPDRAYVGDITYFWTAEGWLYWRW